MKIRRCAVLYVESREDLAIDWQAILSGRNALAGATRWVALAPHLDRELDVGADDLPALGGISQSVWRARAELERRYGADSIERLLEQGLLIADTPEYASARERDDTLRAIHWRPLSALAHTFGRWREVSAVVTTEGESFQEMLNSFGEPPPPTLELNEEGALKLPAAVRGPLDETLFLRYTGRNYDTAASLPLAVAARLLQRTFGAQELRQIGPHASVLKKTSPSGGALHPVEAFVLAQRVDGVEPGLYHYHPIAHELRPVRTMPQDEAAALAASMLGDQAWLAGAAMQVILVGRTERSFWKYRNHQKAYRALALDAGHLSQTFYLLAAEAGLPAFITAAINDADIEQQLGLDHLKHAVIAMCGCGKAAAGTRHMVELRYGETDAGPA
ncbi:putative peptide maturation dehydrogenase [Duganella callida]|uniref:Putative peptide maturation dehydrogenase n=1 Tax=Duganella callida TaxID=2561932 RepID=A0A4Y9SH88_9BURK|nr:putative peptide maturation dehydrogenase [Duganella callida]TFW23270.1 putative peptide maturation dehydrogenase [Duganella callida]